MTNKLHRTLSNIAGKKIPYLFRYLHNDVETLRPDTEINLSSICIEQCTPLVKRVSLLFQSSQLDEPGRFSSFFLDSIVRTL
eukprot:1955951-Ditylum_brightwellii.AAC.1